MQESFEAVGGSWAPPPGPVTPPSLSLSPSEIAVTEPYQPPIGRPHATPAGSWLPTCPPSVATPAGSQDTPSVASEAGDINATPAEGNARATRVAALASAQARRDSAQKELSRLRTIMEEAYDEEEVGVTIDEMNTNPAEFLASRRPLFRKAAAAIKEEKDAAALIAQVEQEIRDHSMSPADMLVEVRSLIRKQNVEFEAMREQNAELIERIAVLEEVVKALVSLPQISQSASDVCAFAQTEVQHKALHGVPTSATLFQHATKNKLSPVIDYLLTTSAYRCEPHALVLLDPPEKSRKYEVPKTTSESSVLTQEAFWGAYKEAPNKQRGWLQLDAGRKVNLLGWKLQVQSPCAQAREGSYLLSVSDNGQTWHQVPKQGTWQEFDRRVVPNLAAWGDQDRWKPATHWNSEVAPILREAYLEITHKDQVYTAQECIASARYFRLIPRGSIAQDAKRIRFGLIILDDGGKHIVGPRRVRDLSPLHVAAKTGDIQMIATLLHHGADQEMLAGVWKPSADQEFTGGWTALQLAATSASLEAVKMLVDHGAKVHEDQFEVPMGKAGDLVAGFLQTNGSKPVTRTAGD